MRSRRIILSDDEESPRKESSARMILSTPGSSTELLNHLSNLNVRSAAKTTEKRNLSSNKPNSASSSSNKKAGIAAPQSEEDEFNSSDELDAESTLRAMQGNLEQASQEGEDYEAMIQPVRNTKHTPPVTSATSASRDSRTSTSGGSRALTSSRPAPPAESPQSPTGRPRRQSAVRAQQLLQNIYSEYDKSDRQNNNNDDEGSDTSHQEEEDTHNQHTDHRTHKRASRSSRAIQDSASNSDAESPSNALRERTEEEQDAYFIDDSGLPSPEQPAPRSRRTSRTSSRTSANTTSGKRQSKRASHSSRSPQTEDGLEEEEEGPRRVSARSASLSSRKEHEYQEAQRALRRASGLSTVLLSSDEEEEGGEGQNEQNEQEEVYSDAQPRTQERSDSEAEARRGSGYGGRSMGSSGGRGGSSGGGKKNNTTYSYSKSKIRSPSQVVGLLHRRDERETETYSSSGESDIDDFIVHSDEEREEEEHRQQQAELRRQQRRERKGSRGSGSSRGGSRGGTGGKSDGSRAMDIVTAATERYHSTTKASSTSGVSSGSKHKVITIDSDEGEGEEEMVISRSSQKPTQSSTSGASSGTTRASGASSDRGGSVGAGGSGISGSGSGGISGISGSGGRKRKVILDSDDEQPPTRTNNTSTTTNTTNTTNSTNPNKRAKHTTNNTRTTSNDNDTNSVDSFIAAEESGDEGSVGSGSDSGTSNSSSNSNSGSEGSGSEEEESDLDGPMLYYKVNSMRDRREEEQGGLTSLTSMRKRFTIAEAMRYYIELMAHVLIDPGYLQEAHHPGSTPTSTHHSSHHHHHQHKSKQQKQDQRAHVELMTHYTSATRQIENLICTNRESLIGSGAWNKEFYGELQSRPFYAVAPAMLCVDSRAGLGMYDVPSDHDDNNNESGDENIGSQQYLDPDKVKCAACNRTTQRPDLQVYLFGSTYDARQVWNSSRWDTHMPRELFLYTDEDPADGDYMHHPDSNINNSGSKNRYGSGGGCASGCVYGSSGGSGGGGSATKTPVTKNRQMKALNTIMSGEMRTYGGVNILTNNTSTSMGSGSKGICIDDDMAQIIRNRKRRIVQSDSEGEGEKEGEKEGEDGGGEVVVRGSGGGWSKRRRAGSADDPVELDGEDGNNDSGDDSSDLEILPCEEQQHAALLAQQALLDAELTRAWWKQKFPREFTTEREKTFLLSAHCKNRTRLYHTLLHYKFRLLMNIRAKIQSVANVMCGQQNAGSQGAGGSGRKHSSQGSTSHSNNSNNSNNAYMYDTSWESWEGPDRQYLLEAAVEELKQDSAFLDGEARRFQTLIKETERRYGGREEPRHDIWGDDDHHGSHPAYTARHSSGSASGARNSGGNTSGGNTSGGNTSGGGGTSSNSGSRGPMSQQSKTIMGWLTKQK